MKKKLFFTLLSLSTSLLVNAQFSITPENSFVFNGGGTWGSILRMTCLGSSSDTRGNFTISKKDGTRFSGDGTLYLRKGSYNGASIGQRSVKTGDLSSTISYTFPSNGNYPQKIYAYFNSDKGGYAWVGSVTIDKQKPQISAVSPTSAVLGKSVTFTINGTNLNNDLVYYIPNFGSGSVNSSSSTTRKYFTTTPSINNGIKNGEIKDKSGGTVLKTFQVNVYFPIPTGLSVNAISSSQINLNWNSVSNRYNYKLYRATSQNGSYSLIKTTLSTSYSNTNLSANSTYYYKIKACQASNSNSCSELSSYKSATTSSANNPPNNPSINPFVNGTIVRVNEPITFTVKSGTDNDGDKTNVHFSARNSNVWDATKFESDLENGSRTYSVSVTFNQVGNQEVFATSFDEHGIPSSTISKVIPVLEVQNTPPNAPSINPFVSGTVVRINEPITFTIKSGTDNDGDKTNIHFTARNSDVWEATKFTSDLENGSRTYQVVVTFNQIGNQEVFATTFDEHGEPSTTLTKIIVVEEQNSSCNYSDAIPSDWWYDAVQDLCSRDILDDDGESNPTEDLNRAELAKLAYLAIGLNTSNSFADNYPSPFNDLQDKNNAWYYSFAKNLSYLEFDDHTAPFDRDYFNFRPSAGISRAHTLKVLLEGFNIDETQNSGNNPFSDFDTSHESYDYIIKARDLGIIKFDSNKPKFEPNDDVIRAEAFVMLYNMLSVLKITPPNIYETDFYKPGNYTPTNFNNFSAMHSGNFGHYNKTSFGIPSIGIPLVFSHSYNSYLSDIPNKLTPIQPLGKLWSHSFNGYLQEIDGDTERPNDFRVVLSLPNGGFQTFKKQGSNYVPETEGIYDELVKISSTKFTLTTKSQIVYTFEKLSNTDADFPFVLTSIKDRNNNTLTITYENAYKSGFKRIDEVIGTARRKLEFHYHTQSDLISKVDDPLGRDVDFIYNSDGYLSRYTNPKHKHTKYNYGTGLQKEMLMTITLPKGNIITNTYEKKKLKSTQTNGNTATDYNYDFENKTIFTDSEGKTTETTYNDLGNPKEIKQGSTTVTVGYHSMHKNLPNSISYNGNTTQVSYDTKGNVTQRNLPLGIIQRYEYNTKNDLEKYTDGKGFNYNYFYNGTGNLIRIQTPRGSTTFSVNGNGQITQVTNPENISVNFEYDKYGNMDKTIAPEGIVANSSYDVASRLKSVTNPNGHSIYYTLDDNDNLLNEVFNGQTTAYEVDENDNVTKIINAKNNATTLGYNADDDTLETVNFGNATDQYSYYDNGAVKTYTNPKGIVFTYIYDDKVRLKSITGGGKTVSYTYDSQDRTETVSNENGAIRFGYDALDRVAQTTDYYGNVVQYDYDKNSNVTKITYPNNKIVTYTFYDDNLLKSVTDWNNQTTNYTYRNDGLLDQTTYANGTFCKLSYDGAGRITGKTWKKSDNTIINGYSFELDKLGNHTKEIKTEPFGAIAFDTQNTNNSFNSVNHITSDGTNAFTFDKNGNNTSNGEAAFSFDVYDRLINVNSAGFNASYKYDALNNRREKTVNGTTQRFVLDILGLSKVLLETDANNSAQNYYIYGLGLISRIDANDNTHYYHDDFRGSIIALTDENETITYKYQYTDFGTITQIEEANHNPYRYVGKHGIQFEQNGLYFMRARYYDAHRGRFLTEDPVWATNLYPYAGNNPVMNIDPSGNISQEADALLTALVPAYGAYKAFKFTTQLGMESCESYSYGYINSDSWVGKTGNAIGGISCLWTPDTALETAFTLGTAGIGTGASIVSKSVAKGGVNLLTQFSKSTIDDAVILIMKDPNKIGHLFASKHKLGTLVNQLGGQKSTVRAVLNALNGKLPVNGVFSNISVNVLGQSINVSGNVINGGIRIGTMFIK